MSREERFRNSSASFSIDDYAKMADQGRSDFYVVFTMSLCALGLK